MIFKYGSYAHDDNECALTIAKEALFGERGRREGVRERWTIRGELQESSTSALTTAIDAMLSAYSRDGQSAGLYLSDGSTLTSHFLNSSAALGGVRVVKPPEFPLGAGAEYGTFRTYEIQLEADFPAAGANLISWVEVISFVGAGGPDWDLVPVINGLWPRQESAETTPYRAVQRGRSVGQFSYISPPPPIWPAHEQRKMREWEPQGPKVRGNDLTLYEWSWAYHFLSATPLTGLPNWK